MNKTEVLKNKNYGSTNESPYHEKTVLVKMAEIEIIKKEENNIRYIFKSILGSCVGIIISDSVRKVYGFAHIMLPYKMNNDPLIGKYADLAIPYMIELLEKEGASRENLKAFLVGGANLFKSFDEDKISTIGIKNIKISKKILERLGIPIVFMDTGGRHGRVVLFDVTDERIEVKSLKNIMKETIGRI